MPIEEAVSTALAVLQVTTTSNSNLLYAGVGAILVLNGQLLLLMRVLYNPEKHGIGTDSLHESQEKFNENTLEALSAISKQNENSARSLRTLQHYIKALTEFIGTQKGLPPPMPPIDGDGL